MPRITIGFGIALIVLGVLGYLLTLGGGSSITALIPALFGLALGALGLVAQQKEDWRKHAMHAAAVVGVLGILGTLRVIPNVIALLTGGTVATLSGTIAQVVMLVLCVVFVGLCVRSFIDARRTGAV
jgi:hypothetical protein